MRIFCRPPVAISASLAATSLPLTKADIAIRLEAPRMIPSIVRSERNLCAQISLSPMLMALHRFTTNRGSGGAMEEREFLWLRLRRAGLHGSFSIRRFRLCSGALFGAARCVFRVDPVQPTPFRVNVFGNLAVADFDAARGGGSDFRIVRDEGYGPAFLTERAELFQDHFVGLRVEVA